MRAAGSPAIPGRDSPRRPRFLEVFQKETLEPTWYEKALWHLYDCTDYAANLLQCPTVAYSGELDNQKQAADVMAEALGRGDPPGPRHRPGHQARLPPRRQAGSGAAARQHRRARPGADLPESFDFVTYTLKYNQMSWVTIDALGEHWARASVRARLVGDSAVEVVTPERRRR